MQYVLRFGLAVLGVVAFAQPAAAFCGFYVTKADTQLFNKASQVVLVRDGDRTVMTMANDFRGNPKEFAMVIPVPTVLQREQIHVGDKQLIDHLDAYSAPRLVPGSEKHLVFFPAFDELGVAMPVAPRDVRQDRPAAVLMIRIVGVGQREIADAREDRFDPIQPRGVGRREDELHVVVGGPVGHLASLVRREVVEHEVEARGDRVARANVREEQ